MLCSSFANPVVWENFQGNTAPIAEDHWAPGFSSKKLEIEINTGKKTKWKLQPFVYPEGKEKNRKVFVAQGNIPFST